MTKNNFVSIASFVFLVVGILHVLRLLNSWEVLLGDFVVPMWVSWVALALAGYLAYSGFRMTRS